MELTKGRSIPACPAGRLSPRAQGSRLRYLNAKDLWRSIPAHTGQSRRRSGRRPWVYPRAYGAADVMVGLGLILVGLAHTGQPDVD